MSNIRYRKVDLGSLLKHGTVYFDPRAAVSDEIGCGFHPKHASPANEGDDYSSLAAHHAER
jgi:hypothetical protein